MKYHAHVYYTDQTRPIAEKMHKTLSSDIVPIEAVWRMIDRNVGPHTTCMFEVDFDESQEDRLIEWLNANREGLSVLIHPLIDDQLAAHTTDARWLGESLELNLDKL